MADITLTVGVDVENSFDEFKTDINTLVNKINESPQRIKVGFDSNSLSTMKSQIATLRTEIESAFSSMSTTTFAGMAQSMESFVIGARDFANAANRMDDSLTVIWYRLNDIRDQLNVFIKAIPEAGSALANMGKEGSVGLEQMYSELQQVEQLIKELNSKDFNITQNLTYSSSAAKSNAQRLTLLRNEALELNKVIQDLANTWISLTGKEELKITLDESGLRKTNEDLGKLLYSDFKGFDEYEKRINSATTPKAIANTTAELQSYYNYLTQIQQAFNEVMGSRGLTWSVDSTGLEQAKQALEDYDTQNEKIRNSFSKTAESADKLSQSQAQIAQVTEKVSKSQKEATEATEKLNEAQSETKVQEQAEVDTQSTEKYTEAVTKMCSEIDAKLTELRTKIEQTFDFSTLQLNPDSIYSVIDRIKEELSKLEINVTSATATSGTIVGTATGGTTATTTTTEKKPSGITAISTELGEVKKQAISATEAVEKLTSAAQGASKATKASSNTTVGKTGTATGKSSAATTSSKSTQKLTSDMIEYDRAVMKVNTTLQQVITNQQKWNASQNGSTSEAYQSYTEQRVALEALLQDLNDGKLTADEFNKRFADIQTTMSSAVTEFTEAGSKTNVLTEGTKQYDNAIKSANVTLQQVITNQEKWNASQNGSTSEAYKVYQEQEVALRELIDDLQSGTVTSEEFALRLAEIQATMATAVTEFTEAGSKVNLLTEGTKEYNNALNSIAQQLNTVEANQKKWSSAAGNSNGAYESYSQLADRLRELDTEVRSGTMSSSDYQTALSAIRAEATSLAPTVKQVAEDLDAQNEKMKNIVTGSTEYKDALSAINTQLKALETNQRKWTTVTSQNNVDASQYSDIGTQNAALTQQLEALKTQLNSGSLSMDDYTTSLNAIKIATSEYTLSLERAISAIKEKAAAEKEGGSASKETLATEQQKDAAEKAYQSTLLNATNFLVRYSAAQNSSNESSRKAYSAVENLVDSLRQERNQMGDTTKSVQKFREGLTNANRTITESTVTLKQNGDATKSLGDRMSKLVSQFSMWFSVSRLVMQSVRAIRELISASIDLDDAMTQLKIVTNETASTYEKFGDQIAETAQKIGASITDLTDSVTTYARLGYSLEESSTLAEYTSMLQNVGDIDVDLAQEAITSMIKAFDLGVDEIESVMDELVAVGKDKVPKRMVTYVKKVAISVKLQRWTRPSKDLIFVI